MTVAELEARMPAREFREWMAYAAIEPFGPLTAYERAGVLASQIVAPHMKKGNRAPDPAVFFPVLKGPEQPFDAKSARRRIEAWFQKKLERQAGAAG